MNWQRLKCKFGFHKWIKLVSTIGLLPERYCTRCNKHQRAKIKWVNYGGK